jgi:hypothetical protein
MRQAEEIVAPEHDRKVASFDEFKHPVIHAMAEALPQLRPTDNVAKNGKDALMLSGTYQWYFSGAFHRNVQLRIVDRTERHDYHPGASDALDAAAGAAEFIWTRSVRP